MLHIFLLETAVVLQVCPIENYALKMGRVYLTIMEHFTTKACLLSAGCCCFSSLHEICRYVLPCGRKITKSVTDLLI